MHVRTEHETDMSTMFGSIAQNRLQAEMHHTATPSEGLVRPCPSKQVGS